MSTLGPWNRVAAFLALVLAASFARAAEVVHNSDPEFTVVIPDGFVPEPRIVASRPAYIHGFVRAAEKDVGTVIVVERMGGVLGRGKLDISHMPAAFKGRLLSIPWNGFDLEMFEVPEETAGVKLLTYNVQVPLRGHAVQLKVVGKAEIAEELRATMGALLNSLTGETNWIKSIFPESFASSKLYLVAVIAIMALVVVGGAVGAWIAGRRLPRGAVLGIGIGLLVLGLQLPKGGVREMRGVTGGTSLLGTVLVIVGIVQLVHRRGQA